ncbi:hypothetical protein BDZ89DRAFT_1045092 [Hymenopellis radicata]|nr:hypothetical protein BDZ89DRAFT_1045092 [Hymenopellis radicata]
MAQIQGRHLLLVLELMHANLFKAMDISILRQLSAHSHLYEKKGRRTMVSIPVYPSQQNSRESQVKTVGLSYRSRRQIHANKRLFLEAPSFTLQHSTLRGFHMEALFQPLLLKAPPPGLSHANKFEVLFPPSPLGCTTNALQLFRKVKKMDKDSSWRSRANCLIRPNPYSFFHVLALNNYMTWYEDCLQKTWDNASPLLRQSCPTCRQKVSLVHFDWISANHLDRLTARYIKAEMRNCRKHHNRSGKVQAKVARQLSGRIDQRPPGSMVDMCSLEDIIGLSRAVDLALGASNQPT